MEEQLFKLQTAEGKEQLCRLVFTFDAEIEKIAYSRARMSYLPNIYILGESGVQKFCEVFIKVAE